MVCVMYWAKLFHFWPQSDLLKPFWGGLGRELMNSCHELTQSLFWRTSLVWRPAGTWGSPPPSSSGAGPSRPWLQLDVGLLYLCTQEATVIYCTISTRRCWVKGSQHNHVLQQEHSAARMIYDRSGGGETVAVKLSTSAAKTGRAT